MRTIIFSLFISLALNSCQPKHQSRTAPWSVEQTDQWRQQWGWLRGCNFLPSTAINTLEMWQAETFDPVTIDRELGWASDIGMNCMRVFLHHVAWEVDREGLKKRMGQYLDIADKHGISTSFVFFCDCFNSTYSAGKQPEPKPGVHNSGWVKDPGDLLFEKPELINVLETYVKDVLTTFKYDQRIALWDLYNEPGNSGYGGKSLNLVQKSFEWAWAVNPSQPLTAGVWNGWTDELRELNKFMLGNSDIISYHSYADLASQKIAVDTLKRYRRPILCTEYMARHYNSTFQSIMPMLKRENIGAFNWGLVEGKTNTIFSGLPDEPLNELSEPLLWLHDIFHKDGTPFSQEEINLIKSLCGK